MGAQVVNLALSRGEDTVWTAWVKAYKLRNDDILTVLSKPSDSMWWKATLRVRDLLNKEPNFVQEIAGLPKHKWTQVLYD